MRNPIDELRSMLTNAGIPYESYVEKWPASIQRQREKYFGKPRCDADYYARNQIIYGSYSTASWKLDAIYNYGSYGRQEGLLEIWGDMVPGDPKTKTPAEVFDMIKADWEKNQQKPTKTM